MQRMAKVKDPLMERMRENLVRFIAESGYTQNQVADMSGVPQASLGRYIRGENALQVDALKALADVFGRSTDDFYQVTPPPPDPEKMLPFFLKHRPGAELSEEDQKDADEFFERVRARRAKKAAPRKPK